MKYCPICKKVLYEDKKCCMEQKYNRDIPEGIEERCKECPSKEELYYVEQFGVKNKFGGYMLCKKHFGIRKELSNKISNYDIEKYILVTEDGYEEELYTSYELEAKLKEIYDESDYDYKENCFEHIIVFKVIELMSSEIDKNKIVDRNCHLLFMDGAIYAVDEIIKPSVELSLDGEVYF